ncbi:ABC transporter permease [Desulfoluna spongiiphila]|uniref:ABC transporter permease n=1 Tax=Desulfoluna spongiiphila TaxID=419481 RepID=UPI0012585752|nr:ABC transporter permease [Desulfoluna spongiiphila]VVS94278.1 abc transporter permease [Desulfoluna spongiiphila]
MTTIPAYVRNNPVQWAITLIFAVLLASFMALAPHTFLHGRIYIAYLSTIPFAGMVALAMTLVIITGEMDLSFPAVMAACGFAFSKLFAMTGSPGAGLMAAIAVGALAGGLNSLLVVGFGVPAIIATIGTQFFWRGATVLLAGGLAVNMPEIRETALHHLMVGRWFDLLPAQAVWFAMLTGLFWLILNRHVAGDHLRFCGDNPEAARMMGIPTAKVRTGVFVLMGMVTGLSGAMVCMEMASWWPTQGEGYMLLVFAAVFVGGTSVFGGTGTIYGTLMGAIIIGMIEAGIISIGLSGLWTRMVYGVVIMGAVSVHALITPSSGKQS